MTSRTAGYPPQDDRSVTRREEVAERILGIVRRLGLGPGELLPAETELCERLRASRSSVREALRTLAALDLVEVRHGQGTYVGAMGLTPLTTLLVTRAGLGVGGGRAQLRAALRDLESGAADRLVVTTDTNRAELLAEQAHGVRDLALRGQQMTTAARDFHAVLVAPLRDTLSGELDRALWAALLSAPGEGPPVPGWSPALAGDVHEALADGVRRGSADDLRGALGGYFGGDASSR